MNTEIPWKHYFFCAGIYGLAVTAAEDLVPMTPLLRGLLLVSVVTAYILIGRARSRPT